MHPLTHTRSKRRRETSKRGELFPSRRRTYTQSMAMKGLLTSRSELRWFAVAVPTLFLAHWLFSTLGSRLVSMLPYSLRAVLHLL